MQPQGEPVQLLKTRNDRQRPAQEEPEEEEAGPTELRDLPPVTVQVEEGPQGLPADFDWRHYLRMYPGAHGKLQ